jgi:hypothetical protein
MVKAKAAAFSKGTQFAPEDVAAVPPSGADRRFCPQKV